MEILHTPAGEIFIERNDGRRIPFTAQPNPYRPACGAMLPEETLLLTTEAEEFDAGCSYRFVLSTGKMHFCGADEDWQALCAVHNGCAAGLAARDPNDSALMCNDWQMQQYRLCIAKEGNGFELHILENLHKPIVFHAAWVRTDGAGTQDCEYALGLWLT